LAATNKAMDQMHSAATQPTLSELLARLGISHAPSQIAGKRDWFTGSGNKLGTFDAAEGWAALKSGRFADIALSTFGADVRGAELAGEHV
jgi:hypothetical protein